MMTCEICGRGPHEGISLFRQNPTGETGVWRCAVHNEVPQDPDVVEIVTIIEQGSDETD